MVPQDAAKALKLYLDVKDRTCETHSKASASRRCKHQIAGLIRGAREPSMPVTCQTGKKRNYSDKNPNGICLWILKVGVAETAKGPVGSAWWVETVRTGILVTEEKIHLPHAIQG